MKLRWTDAEDLALALADVYPDQDPLRVRFTDLRRQVMELASFDDDPGASSEGKLEAIQMAWWEEWKERHR